MSTRELLSRIFRNSEESNQVDELAAAIEDRAKERFLNPPPINLLPAVDTYQEGHEEEANHLSKTTLAKIHLVLQGITKTLQGRGDYATLLADQHLLDMAEDAEEALGFLDESIADDDTEAILTIMESVLALYGAYKLQYDYDGEDLRDLRDKVIRDYRAGNHPRLVHHIFGT